MKLHDINLDILQKLIIDYRNDLTSHLDDDYAKTGRYPDNYTKDDAVNNIYAWVMCGKDKYLKSSRRNIVLDKKSVHFIGRKTIRQMIEQLVESDYKFFGWNFPNNFYNKEISHE